MAAVRCSRCNRVAKPDPKMLELLVCPVTRTSLKLDETGVWLTSAAAHLKFPIRDGIPIMLVEEAEPFES
ncbi:MAG: hypothetical protein COA52_05430 [Hyphomicrobiales bacterium]|nr:Trm112 family protein [Hyphomicrobiales bacterium]PCJ94333.1 MAG: hypothetical protein COA52_05430 [Hyphomicrobiales bacterium]